MRTSISATRDVLRRLFFQRCFYLFVTLLALTRPARSAAIVESIVGQLYLTILIARLVGVYPQPQRVAATIQATGSNR
jgi:hypothetical protein